MPRGVDVEILDGFYDYEGEVDGKPYTGLVSIQKKVDIYVVRFFTGADGYVGVGMRHGELFVVGWSSHEARGVTAFSVKPGPSLSGSWTSLPGDGRKHSEKLDFIKPFKKQE